MNIYLNVISAIFDLWFFYTKGSFVIFSLCSPANILLFAVPPIYEKNKVSLIYCSRNGFQ